MINLFDGKKAVSNIVFAVSVSGLLILCVALGLMLSYQPSNIQSDYDQLQSDYDQLQIDFGLSQSKYDSLEANYENLQLNHETLQSEYDQLGDAYQQLITNIPTGQGITIDSIYYKPHYYVPSGVYNVTVRNHCSSEVHVTALKLYHDSTLISSKAVSVPIPADSAVTIEEFLGFSLTEVLHVLKVETAEGYTVTSDPLSN